MADFCKQCSEELFDRDCKDLAGLCAEPEMAHVICEGCGFTDVNHLGECIKSDCLVPGHHAEKDAAWRTNPQP